MVIQFPTLEVENVCKRFGSRAVGQRHISSPFLYERSVGTTSIRAEGGPETKAKAVAHCEPETTRAVKYWSEGHGLMTFLRSL